MQPESPAQQSDSPSVPRVDVWLLHADGSPGRWLGPATLVLDQLVVLHVTPHPRPAHRSGGRPPRARVRLRHGSHTQVLDGTLSPGAMEGTADVWAVALDGAASGRLTELPWPNPRIDTEAGTRAFLAALADLATVDTPGDPGPAPDRADEPSTPVTPKTRADRPWWCWMFPFCAGC